MFGRILLIGFIAAIFTVSTVLAQAEAPKPAAISGKAGSSDAPAATKKVAPATERAKAQAEFDSALGVVKNAREIGDHGQAFLLYTNALLSLRKIRGKYPDFKPKEVDAKIDEVKGTLRTLEDAVCQNLEEEKQGRFRYLVWKRQLLILDKLDRLEKAVTKNEKMLEELKDKFGI